MGHNAIDHEKYYDKKKEMIEFLNSNVDKYQQLSLLLSSFIIDNSFTNAYEMNIPTTLCQIFSKFGVFKEEYDPYIEFKKILDKYSFLDDSGTYCEIGAGIYPRLSEIVFPSIDKNHGSLTIYDPNCMFSISENIHIVNEEFTYDTDIQKIDTLYALYPCEATPTILEKAFEEDKNLVLGFCNCDHSDIKYPYTDEYKYWADGVCKIYQTMYGSDLEIIGWPSNMKNDLPIMVRRSTKHKQKNKSL